MTESELKDFIIELQQENQELKKQLEEFRLDIINGEPYIKLKTVINQQEEFIEYLKNCINELKKESMNELQNTINLGIVDITKEILSKYKEIIGTK